MHSVSCFIFVHCSVSKYSEVEMLPQNIMRALRSAMTIKLVYRLTLIIEINDTNNLKENNFDL